MMNFNWPKVLPKKTKTAATGLVTAAMVTMGAFIATTSDIGAPMTKSFEGEVLKNYIDSVGVETWCTGETQIGRLEKGYTREYCRMLFLSRYMEYSKKLYLCYDDTARRNVTPAMHATFTDVFYNTGARCKSGMVKLLQMGEPVKACEKTLDYKRAGGRDCSKDKGNPHGCYGVYDRRLKMLPICMNDALRIPRGGLGPSK